MSFLKILLLLLLVISPSFIFEYFQTEPQWLDAVEIATFQAVAIGWFFLLMTVMDNSED